MEVYSLTKWLDEKQNSIKTLTQQQIADLATIDCGFKVTSANMVMAGKCLGILIGKTHHYVPKLKNPDDAIRTLAIAVCGLYERFALFTPEEIKTLSGK